MYINVFYSICVGIRRPFLLPQAYVYPFLLMHLARVLKFHWQYLVTFYCRVFVEHIRYDQLKVIAGEVKNARKLVH